MYLIEISATPFWILGACRGVAGKSVDCNSNSDHWVCTCFLCFGVYFQVALPHSLPLPRRETLQQSSSLSTVSPATVDLTLKVHLQAHTHTHNCPPYSFF